MTGTERDCPSKSGCRRGKRKGGQRGFYTSELVSTEEGRSVDASSGALRCNEKVRGQAGRETENIPVTLNQGMQQLAIERVTNWRGKTGCTGLSSSRADCLQMEYR